MTTADLSLRFDPIYEPISRRYHQDPQAFADAFARAWFKLTHRDMGPRARYLGPEVPAEELIWQDPVPAVDHELVGEQDIGVPQDPDPRLGPVHLPTRDHGLGVGRDLPRARTSAAGPTGRVCAWRRRRTGRRNQPAELAKVLGKLEAIQQAFNAAQSGNKRISLADLIVLAGGTAIEEAARQAGHDVRVPFAPGRTDASQSRPMWRPLPCWSRWRMVSAITSVPA